MSCANANFFSCFKLFFHQYFTRKNEKEKAKIAKVGKRKGDEASSSEDSPEEDDEQTEKSSSDDAEGEVADVVNESDSDPDEAEIWKVLIPKGLLKGCSSILISFFIGNEGYNAQSPGRR